MLVFTPDALIRRFLCADMEVLAEICELTGVIDSRLSPSEMDARIGIMEDLISILQPQLTNCTLCPRRCEVNRYQEPAGECGLGVDIRVASVACHKGEEPPISGEEGAINVFFSGCNLHCLHCQNWPISQKRVGSTVTPEELSARILKKWRRGMHSLGWVTPTPQIVGALEAYLLCLRNGFDLPLIHNNGGYENPEVVDHLSHVVDVWLPDAKTADDTQAAKIQGAPNYVIINLQAIAAMVNQVEEGNARAVIVRHMVMPAHLDDSRQVLNLLWDKFGSSIYLSLMGQYFPAFHTVNHGSLGRKLSEEEYNQVIEEARKIGFKQGWVQHYDTETGVLLDCL
ncbi:radical SAM protein [candidate division LCP-89 bacterium B3_LCP]|uniref:Radical SAM protein n=1 Tax=candidate division LCP-89 bacterium B3_LCP TaxID=2012998 RepID=A0A532UZF6_UNCL8|nr:MAG: radical SAM protein [candidate division LCP-89 bacterium B3_LCP]